MNYSLYEVEYMSCEGNYRTAHMVVKSDDILSSDTAMSVYYSNSDAWGDSPSSMISASYVTSYESEEEIREYCNNNDIFYEIYEY